MLESKHTTVGSSSVLVNYSSDSESDSDTSDVVHSGTLVRDRDRPAAMPLLPRSQAAPNGQWPIHIHAPLGPLADRLADLIDKIQCAARQSFPNLVSLIPLPSGPLASSSSASSMNENQLHISLSRAGTWLPRSQIAACVSMIQTDLDRQRPVQVQLGRVAHLVNDTGTRRFLVLECTAGQVGLARWLRVVDQVLEKQLGRKPFYEKPRFHASIGYVDLTEPSQGETVKDDSDSDEARWDEAVKQWTLEFRQQLAQCVVKLGRIEIQTGERRYQVELTG